MKLRVIGSVVVVLCAVAAFAQSSGDAGILYGTDYVFTVTAPAGWILDSESGKSQGFCAVLYESGKTWLNADTVIYANTVSKRIKGQETLQEFLAYDVASFKKRSPALSVTPAADLKTKEGKAIVRRFEGDQHGNFEAVAYLDEEFTIVMLVLSSRTKAGLESAYPTFEKLVGSYRFLTSNVKIEK